MRALPNIMRRKCNKPCGTSQTSLPSLNSKMTLTCSSGVHRVDKRPPVAQCLSRRRKGRPRRAACPALDKQGRHQLLALRAELRTQQRGQSTLWSENVPVLSCTITLTLPAMLTVSEYNIHISPAIILTKMTKETVILRKYQSPSYAESWYL